MQKIIPYIIAAALGLMIRPTLAALQGWEYAINWLDFVNAAAMVTALWSGKALFLPLDEPQQSKKKSRR